MHRFTQRAAVAATILGSLTTAASSASAASPHLLPRTPRCEISGDPSGTYWQVTNRREAWIPMGKPLPGIMVNKGGTLGVSKTRKVSTSTTYTSQNQIGFNLGDDGFGFNLGNTSGVSWNKTISVTRTTNRSWQNTFSTPASLEFWSRGVDATVQEWRVETTQKGCKGVKVSPAVIRQIFSPLKNNGYTIDYGWTNTDDPKAYAGSYNSSPHEFVANPVEIPKK